MSERAQVTLQIVIVVGVLAAAVYGIASSALSAPPAVTATAPAPPDASLIASTLRSPSPSPSAAPSPTAAVVTLPPSPSPSPSPRPPTLEPYSFGGRSYTGVSLGKGSTAVAPFDARVELHVYQLVDGQIREFTDVAGIPSYPYVILTDADGRRLTLRPGALTTDTQLLARESQVTAGAELFRVVGEGPSSWHDFYDEDVRAQIIVSLVNAAGFDLDAAPFVRLK